MGVTTGMIRAAQQGSVLHAHIGYDGAMGRAPGDLRRAPDNPLRWGVGGGREGGPVARRY